MKFQPVKGTRDFYPEQMAVRNYIVNGWKAASVRSGFVEYDGPIFEYLAMYQAKSGQEIAQQLFSLTDRGGRELAIRPEITPTLARMVNEKINSLPRPIKWFSVPRLCRAENTQKGRLREFFQWNIDVIGVDDVIADADVIFTSIDYLRSTGLTAGDIQAKISSRKLLAAVLVELGISGESLDAIYVLLDKKTKLPAETFDAMLLEKIGDGGVVEKIKKLMEITAVEQIADIVRPGPAVQQGLDEVSRLFVILSNMGIDNYCRFDMSIVRGLAYYTGVVFEVHDVTGRLRAICGGGRYDNLLKDFGGPAISATGMGMGDCVLEILLEEKGLLKERIAANKIDYFVACADERLFGRAVETACKLRTLGRIAEFAYKPGNLAKQLKQADSMKCRFCVIIGRELEECGKLIVKNMADGSQSQISMEEFFRGND